MYLVFCPPHHPRDCRLLQQRDAYVLPQESKTPMPNFITIYADRQNYFRIHIIKLA